MVTLSKRQVKGADRVGGIELMVIWPDSLGPVPEMDPDTEREATPDEKATAERLVMEACRAAGLLPVRVRVANVWRPKGLPNGGSYATHLAITIIGYRWVHASTTSRGVVMFAQ